MQLMSVGDRFVMTRYLPVQDIGVYSMGVSFGLIEKIVLGAFEYAWAPFYYATAREPDAARVFSTVATYGIAVLALMTAGLSAIAADLLNVVTHGQYIAAAGIVTWTAIGVFFYGVYLLTSIGLNITARTVYYPVTTAIGAALNIGLNFALIPRFGIIGAAWANGAAYAVQAGLAFRFSQRFYPVPHEYGRILASRRGGIDRVRRRQEAAGDAAAGGHRRPRHHGRRGHERASVGHSILQRR